VSAPSSTPPHDRGGTAGSQPPRVSIVIPTRDRAALVVEAVESVLRQTFRDFEVLVCDDGSSDDTADRIAAFGASVRFLKLDAAGRPGAPRNRGVEAARGELVAFLDDDDLWEPEKLMRQIEALERAPHADLAYTDRRILYEDGSTSAPVLRPSARRSRRLLDLALAGEFPHLCTVLVRRRLLESIGGFDERLLTGEDLDLWLRAPPVTRAICVPEPLVLVRRRRGSLSDQSGPHAFLNAILVLERRLAAGDLSVLQRLSGRTTLSRLIAGLATACAEAGDRVEARKAALRSLRLAPWSRAAWAVFTRETPRRPTS
jgi:glycosyltransferase involved in cell wall biosynthesis